MTKIWYMRICKISIHMGLLWIHATDDQSLIHTQPLSFMFNYHSLIWYNKRLIITCIFHVWTKRQRLNKWPHKIPRRNSKWLNMFKLLSVSEMAVSNQLSVKLLSIKWPVSQRNITLAKILVSFLAEFNFHVHTNI